MPDIEARHTSAEVSASDLEHAAWREAGAVHLTRYWSGADAPPERHAEARIIWTPAALSVRFKYRLTETPVVNAEPQIERKTLGLWERDVCEMFVAPDAHAPERYFEFEAAPTGEWLDLALRRTKQGRETDWEYASGMSAAAHCSQDEIVIAMRVPWSAFGRTPSAGDAWRVNLFRCVGSGRERGYLAWQPTFTERPDFHVPDAFGWLHFELNE